MAIPKITGDVLMAKIVAAIGAPGGVEAGPMQRIILDVRPRQAIKVYVQYVGDTRLFDIDWSDAQGGLYVRQEPA